MLKRPETDETKARDSLRSLLAQVPTIKLKDIRRESLSSDGSAGRMLANLSVSGRRHVLACEISLHGQPRHVRIALLQLRNYVSQLGRNATPVLIAPYLSQQAQTLCREQDVGFLDLEGNVHLVFNGVFIERTVASQPPVERRELRSLFKPKSERVLSVMLRDPSRTWRVAELADAVGVSLGHVSNVRTGLLDREWGQVSENGLFLSEPDALLDAWRDAYQHPAGQRLAFYSTLHGGAFEDAARRVLGVESDKGRAIFASFSAAHWLAPYGRTGTQYFYADEEGVRRLQATLALSSPAKGENVIVTIPKDAELFRTAVEPAPGVVCTDPVRTYLDLAAAGERGREAADHLRRERLTWSK